MDPVVVEATRMDGRPWKYASFPGFEIISKCDDAITYRYIDAILLGQQLEEAMFPAGCLAPVSTPIPVILYDKEPEKSGYTIPLPTPTTTVTEREFLGALIDYPVGPVTEEDELDYPIICENLYNAQLEGQGNFRRVGLQFRLSHRVPKFPLWLIAGFTGKYGVYSAVGVNFRPPDIASGKMSAFSSFGRDGGREVEAQAGSREERGRAIQLVA